MCFHNSLSVESQTLENRYQAEFVEKHIYKATKHGNAFANIQWPVITSSHSGEISQFGWGLIPGWIKDAESAKKIKLQTLNARSETVFEKPSFRNSIKSKRCLIPSTGFYEWQHEGKMKIPWFIRLKDVEIFSMAGIWDEWTDRNTGEIVRTFSILTTPANAIMEKIHNTKKRMPLMLLPHQEKAWLQVPPEEREIAAFFEPLSDAYLTTEMLEKV
ncbi:MAG: DUF159 family protein [Bacteroidetes bacterium HGW-Bacteroidetes-21]|jgi:putative SOS response-associated peptidase YedK|nr:MAG: DUF159 family protein [Bacteroidetes bacterium HGW-Bacteroidetes-21]